MLVRSLFPFGPRRINVPVEVSLVVTLVASAVFHRSALPLPGRASWNRSSIIIDSLVSSRSFW